MSADPVGSMRYLDTRVAQLDGARKRNMQTIRDRMAPEMVGDVDGVMRTLAPSFHVVYVLPDGTRTELPAGPGIRETFDALCRGGDTTIWVEWDHLVVDEEKMVGIGTVRMVLSGEAAGVMGYPVDDPSGRYSVSSPSTVVIDFDSDGLMTRETLYSDPAAASVRPADPSEAFDPAELAAQVG
jgi:hypothetical protein